MDVKPGPDSRLAGSEGKLSFGLALIAVAVLWALVYLPNLGGEELYGNEAERVLASTEMLKSGDYILPTIGGKEYYNKPPGYNWLVVASYALTGQRNEWSSRLPSAVGMLVAAVGILCLGGRWMGRDARLLTAVIFLTGMGMVNAGRRAEIEAPYVVLTALAAWWWLACYMGGRSRWSMWLVPALLLAFGALMKGPINGAVFYVMVVCVLAYSRGAMAASSAAMLAGQADGPHGDQQRRYPTKGLGELLTLPHVAGIVLILAICLGWVYLAFAHSAASGDMIYTWGKQWLVRVQPDQEHQTNWFRNVSLAFADSQPWVLLVPALWMKRLTANLPPSQLPVYKGLRLAAVISFVAINALPATLARYSLPVYGLTSLLLGWLLAAHCEEIRSDRVWKACILVAFAAAVGLGITGAVHNHTLGMGAPMVVLATAIPAAAWWQRNRLRGGFALTLVTAAAMAILSLQYLVFFEARAPRFGPSAAIINQAVPAGETLYVYKPDREGFLFYLREPLKYVQGPEEITPDVHYLLIPPSTLYSPGFILESAPMSFDVVGAYTHPKETKRWLIRLHR